MLLPIIHGQAILPISIEANQKIGFFAKRTYQMLDPRHLYLVIDLRIFT